ncbi:MAG: ParB/RepB/Spo0J family partition protein [Phycisphaerales bacterium]|jgi:ParB/RepB/Spo0J family partition protein|nr:ParB/RepB/Spo0J family partition protein [Phycisphaerales bacterium]
MREHVVQQVPTGKPVSPGNIRARLDEEEQVSLAQSIARNGILVPLLGHYEGDAIIVDDGHRRLDAARRAGLATVPMLIAETAPTPAERVTLQLLANTQRQGLKVTEHARALHDLMQATGWSAAEVSVRLGRPSPGTISKLLSLLVLPRDVQDLIDAGRIPMSSAYATCTVPDAAERERLIQAVLEGRLTRDRLVAETKAVKAGRPAPRTNKRQRVARERVVIRLGEGRSVAVSAPTLTVDAVVNWFMDLAEQLRHAGADGRPLAEVARSISGNAK